MKAAKGIGPKTGQRVVNELKDKAASVMALAGAGGSTGAAPVVDADDAVIEVATPAPAPTVPNTPNADPAAQAEALSALTNLGYAPGEAASAVAQALGDDPTLNTAGLIRAALKLLAPKG